MASLLRRRKRERRTFACRDLQRRAIASVASLERGSFSLLSHPILTAFHHFATPHLTIFILFYFGVPGYTIGARALATLRRSSIVRTRLATDVCSSPS